jgi:hypothetical protein
MDDGPSSDVLKRALEDNLQGLNIDVAGLDQSVLLELAQRMMNNESVDDILGDYVEELVVDEEEEDEDEDQEDEAQPQPKPFREWISAEGRQRASRPTLTEQAQTDKASTPPSTAKGVKRRASTSPAVAARKKKTRQQPDEVEAQG